MIRNLAVAGALVATCAVTSESATAQGTVVRRDTVVVVHQDTTVRTHADTAVVTTRVTRTSGGEGGSMTIAGTLDQLPNYKTLVSLLRGDARDDDARRWCEVHAVRPDG